MPVSGIHADMVAAEVHSDDHRLKADFDAAPYLSNATPYDIAKLICCDWGGDYPTDNVAQESDNKDVIRVLDYATIVPDMGFEVNIDQDQAVMWLWKNRGYELRDAALKQAHRMNGDQAEIAEENFNLARRTLITAMQPSQEQGLPEPTIADLGRCMEFFRALEPAAASLTGDHLDKFQHAVDDAVHDVSDSGGKLTSDMASTANNYGLAYQIALLTIMADKNVLHSLRDTLDEAVMEAQKAEPEQSPGL